MPLTVIYDANVFYPAPLRDLLIRLAQTPLVRARWTEQILDECFHNLRQNRPDLDPARLQRTRALINQAVRDSLVTGYETLIDGLELPDRDDRHVLAAAIHAGAQAIVTFNLSHFPEATLNAYRLAAIHPDQFVLGLLNQHRAAVLRVLDEQEAALGRPEPVDIITRLKQQGLVVTATRLRPAGSGVRKGRRIPGRAQPPPASARPRRSGGERRHHA